MTHHHETSTVETTAPHGAGDVDSGGRPAPATPAVGRPTIDQLRTAILSCAAAAFCAVDDPQARKDAELAATAAEVLVDGLTALFHYRGRSHRPADYGWHSITGLVDDDMMQLADHVMLRVRP